MSVELKADDGEVFRTISRRNFRFTVTRPVIYDSPESTGALRVASTETRPTFDTALNACQSRLGRCFTVVIFLAGYDTRANILLTQD